MLKIRNHLLQRRIYGQSHCGRCFRFHGTDIGFHLSDSSENHDVVGGNRDFYGGTQQKRADQKGADPSLHHRLWSWYRTDADRVDSAGVSQ